MKIIISENRLHQLIMKYFNSLVSDVKMIRPPGTDKDYFQIHNKYGEFIMDGMKNRELLIDYSILESITTMFSDSIDEGDLKEMIEEWIKEKYGFDANGNVDFDDLT